MKDGHLVSGLGFFNTATPSFRQAAIPHNAIRHFLMRCRCHMWPVSSICGPSTNRRLGMFSIFLPGHGKENAFAMGTHWKQVDSSKYPDFVCCFLNDGTPVSCKGYNEASTKSGGTPALP